MAADHTPLHVTCHSGHTYAQRPTSMRLGNQQYEITKIIAEGHTPEGKWFQVLTQCGLTFRLVYYSNTDNWSISELDKR